MTISEMIATLENIRHEYGDIQIDCVRKDEDDFWLDMNRLSTLMCIVIVSTIAKIV